MRVFICSYRSFSLAIPIDCVSSIFLHRDNSNEKIHYDHEKRNTYISLSNLFCCNDLSIHHGIILKGQNPDSDQIEDRMILLSTEIEREKDIPADKFFPVPKSLGVFQFSSVFSGMFYSIGAGKLILLLNPEQLVQNIKREIL
ncbi:MAG: hypothetical protein FWC01_00350 [Treponema sp.]|nr:hypothetical protein [Treponema sp.]MCL2236708.1 hypothetical protein [Treponema sp.]